MDIEVSGRSDGANQTGSYVPSEIMSHMSHRPDDLLGVMSYEI